MTARHAAGNPATPSLADPLADAVPAELQTRRWHLAFAPAVEARFQADTAQARVRHLLIAGLVALAVYDSFLLNDLAVRPEVFGPALFWRLGCVTVFGLAALALVRRGLPGALARGGDGQHCGGGGVRVQHDHVAHAHAGGHLTTCSCSA